MPTIHEETVTVLEENEDRLRFVSSPDYQYDGGEACLHWEAADVTIALHGPLGRLSIDSDQNYLLQWESEHDERGTAVISRNHPVSRCEFRGRITFTVTEQKEAFEICNPNRPARITTFQPTVQMGDATRDRDCHCYRHCLYYGAFGKAAKTQCIQNMMDTSGLSLDEIEDRFRRERFGMR